MKKILLAFVGLLASFSMLAACDSLLVDSGESSSSSLTESSSMTESNEPSSDSSDDTSEEAHTHNYATEWSYDENNHWKVCTGEECDSKTEEGAHNGGTASCEAKAVCADCGQAYGELAQHLYTVAKYDENNHWNECTCGEIDQTSVEAHNGGTASCEAKAVCADCGQAYGELGDHTYADTLTRGEEMHWYAATCAHNELKKNEAEHSYGEFQVTTEAVGSAAGEKTATCECGETKKEAYVNAGVTGVFGTDVNVSTTQGKAENQLDGSLKVYSDWWVKVAFDGVNIPANATHIIIKMKANQQLTGDDGTGILFEATGVDVQNIGIVETEYKEFKIALSTNNCALSKFNLCVQDGTGVGDSVNNWKVIYIESISFVILTESATPTQTTIFGGDTPVTVGATQGSAVAMNDGSLKLTGAWWVNATFDGVTIPANVTTMVIRAKANQALTDVLYNMSYPGTSIASDEETGLSIGTEYQDFEISLKTNNCSLTNFNLCVADDGSGAWKIVYIESIRFSVSSGSVDGGDATKDPAQAGVFSFDDSDISVVNDMVNGIDSISVSDGVLTFTGNGAVGSWPTMTTANVVFNGFANNAVTKDYTTLEIKMKSNIAEKMRWAFFGVNAAGETVCMMTESNDTNCLVIGPTGVYVTVADTWSVIRFTVPTNTIRYLTGISTACRNENNVTISIEYIKLYTPDETSVIEGSGNATIAPDASYSTGRTLGFTADNELMMHFYGASTLDHASWIRTTVSGATIPEGATKMIIKMKADTAVSGVQVRVKSANSDNFNTKVDVTTEYVEYEFALSRSNEAISNLHICVPENAVLYIESITFA